MTVVITLVKFETDLKICREGTCHLLEAYTSAKYFSSQLFTILINYDIYQDHL